LKKIIFNNEQSERIDSFLSHHLQESRNFVNKMLDLGLVSVNGTIIRKASYQLQENCLITIKPIPKTNPTQDNQLFDIPIIYQDQDLIVINKPAGLLVHAKNNFDHEYCLIDWIKTKFPDLDDERSGLVHRLDRLTSGVMVIGLNTASINYLKKQFKDRSVKKVYYAIVEGLFDDQKLILDLPIARSLKSPSKFVVDQNGRSSITKINVIDQNSKLNLSLLKLSPQTGRTHQLRVHLSYIHHPIVGDILYNKKSAKTRMMLHAYSLALDMLDSKRKIFHATIPPEFKEYFQNEI